MTEDEKLRRYLWDWFVIAQYDILQVMPKDLEKFQNFIAGKSKEVPFVEGSQAWETCKLCGKL